MSYDKNKESMLSFILPTILKQDLEEVCVMYDRNQSQVLRSSIVLHSLRQRTVFGTAYWINW